MSSEISCSQCETVIEIPDNFQSKSTECPNCNTELNLSPEDENPYSAPKANLRGRCKISAEVKFPTICLVMSILIIIFEIIRSVVIAGLMSYIQEFENENGQSVDAQLKFILVLMATMVTIGIFSSILMLCKNKWASLLTKIYATLIVIGVLFSFINFNLSAIVINSLVAIFVTLSIIYYNSYLRQLQGLANIDKQREIGAPSRRRIAGKLVKK